MILASSLALAACSDQSFNATESVNITPPEPPAASPAPLDEFGALTPNPAPGGRMVDCSITNDYGARFADKCLFQADEDGSFALSLPDESPLVDEVVMIGVAITEPGVAEVRGLTTAGINSRWGTAQRLREDPACWAGDDFEICAR
ncbi:hypothetical protein [Stakelama tenebrarum]|uniref:Uncharacterized protein n=1 Tax=Stakelama tenebrarum TaxID=2711215 RepID=A0A6G6Y079_9SPHN|nr:hypothetical protein [Sphingosinithalassobacter tenebrarum]QIG78325.1 hypothetical protein G5C33_06185 [Sphingosinithalassobacter tenebrarum]